MGIFRRETPRDNVPTGRVALTGKVVQGNRQSVKVAADYKPKK